MAIDTIKSTAVLDGAISTADLANDIAINTSGAITTTGAFTSQGIDDNSNATAITIDSAENVLIGNTDATPYDRTSGNAIAMGDGLISSAQPGGNAAIFNRMTSDGSIVGFRKGGSTTGQINTRSGQLSIGVSDTGLEFNEANDNVLPCSLTANGGRDAAIDLGSTDARFKNAYLSGGIYLGGTVSANALNDYEEGSWDAGAWSSQANKYVKVGNLVMLSIDVAGPLSGTISQFTLPFTCTGTSGVAVYTSSVNFNSGYTYATVVVAGTQAYIRQCGDNIAFANLGIGQNGVLHGNITYNTTQ